MSNSVVQRLPASKSYNVHDLQAVAQEGIRSAMGRADDNTRRQHVEILKTLKRMQRVQPQIREYWLTYVGETQILEALKILDQEADAAIVAEDAANAGAIASAVTEARKVSRK